MEGTNKQENDLGLEGLPFLGQVKNGGDREQKGLHLGRSEFALETGLGRNFVNLPAVSSG